MAVSVGFPPLAAAFVAAAGALLLLSLLPQAAAVSCIYHGKSYTGGSSFPAGDGCNVCSCNAQDGTVGCTRAVCRCTSSSDCGSQWCRNGYCTPYTGAGGSCTYPSAANPVAKCRPGLSCLGASATKNGICGSCMYAGKVYQLRQTCTGTDGCSKCTCYSGYPSMKCDRTSCPSACSVSADCASNEFCSAGSCKIKLAPGAVCSNSENCSRGLRCITGVCASCEYHTLPKQAGQIWYDRCNVCKCQVDGVVTCTRNSCPRVHMANAKAKGNRKMRP